MGIGFTFALFLIATVREVFCSGSFAGIEIPFPQMVLHQGK